MTASNSLSEFSNLRHPAADYLSECYQIYFIVSDLIESLTFLLSALKNSTKSAHNEIDNGNIPLIDLVSLNLAQLQGIDLLQEATRDIASYMGFDKYLKAAEKESSNA